VSSLLAADDQRQGAPRASLELPDAQESQGLGPEGFLLRQIFAALDQDGSSPLLMVIDWGDLTEISFSDS
jgi:hypothetical protein